MKSQKLAHKLVKQFSSRFISPPVDRNRRHEEKALRIVSLATIKHKVQQVRTSNDGILIIKIYFL